MKRFIGALFSLLIILISFSACSSDSGNSVGEADKQSYFIKIDDEEIDESYVAYFFHLAKVNMIGEAGFVLGEGGNATQNDIDVYWETTEIDGKNAVDAARDIAADNAVRQKVQYFRAIKEGISLTEEEEKALQSQVDTTIKNNGGSDGFRKRLEEMGTDLEAYTQIVTENIYIRKLYEKYDNDGKLFVDEEKYLEFSVANEQIYSPEMMMEAYKKSLFNDMVTVWEKDYDISINDSRMKEFNV